MSQVEAPKHLKNRGFGDHFHNSGWPKVADAVIEAEFPILVTLADGLPKGVNAHHQALVLLVGVRHRPPLLSTLIITPSAYRYCKRLFAAAPSGAPCISTSISAACCTRKGNASEGRCTPAGAVAQ